MKLDLKEWINKVLKHSIHASGQIALGNITIGSNGYYAFSVNGYVPPGAEIIGYQILFGSNSGAFSVPAYVGTTTQYVVGTPYATITDLRLYAFYYIP